MTNQATATRQVKVLARYFLKQLGIVCYLVLSSDGETKYHTCISQGRVSCTCPGFEHYHKCYHAEQIKALEDARPEHKAATFAKLMKQYDIRNQEAAPAASYDVLAQAVEIVKATEEQALDEAYTVAGKQYSDAKSRETARFATRSGEQGWSLLR